MSSTAEYNLETSLFNDWPIALTCMVYELYICRIALAPCLGSHMRLCSHITPSLLQYTMPTYCLLASTLEQFV